MQERTEANGFSITETDVVKLLTVNFADGTTWDGSFEDLRKILYPEDQPLIVVYTEKGTPCGESNSFTSMEACDKFCDKLQVEGATAIRVCRVIKEVEVFTDTPVQLGDSWFISEDLLAKVKMREPMIQRWKNSGCTSQFRMLDGDNVPYFIGYADQPHSLSPLDEFGMPSTGCTTIEYMIDGKWVATN